MPQDLLAGLKEPKPQSLESLKKDSSYALEGRLTSSPLRQGRVENGWQGVLDLGKASFSTRKNMGFTSQST